MLGSYYFASLPLTLRRRAGRHFVFSAANARQPPNTHTVQGLSAMRRQFRLTSSDRDLVVLASKDLTAGLNCL